ncbi:MAG: 30S ribosomal protein S20 [bacterium]
MANIKSAKKRVLVTERNRLKNIAVRSSVKTAVKKVLDAIKANSEKEVITAALNNAYKYLDKAVSKGVMHKNTVARKKSRLTAHVNNGTLPAR